MRPFPAAVVKKYERVEAGESDPQGITAAPLARVELLRVADQARRALEHLVAGRRTRHEAKQSHLANFSDLFGSRSAHACASGQSGNLNGRRR